MTTLARRLTTLLAALALALPAALSAHAGHAGGHGWLEGAAQPLLSLDHLLAGLVLVAVATLGGAIIARRAGGVPRCT